MSPTQNSNQLEKITEIAKKYFTVKKFAEKNRKNGTYPDSESAIWALRGGAPKNGFGNGVFVTVGRRVLVDEVRFWEAISLLQEVKNGSSK